MSRAARITLVATGVLLLAGLVSGLLIDRHDGLGGAVEWALRTAVVVATVVVLAGGLVLVLRVRRVVRSRVAGWALAAVAGLAFAFFIVQPVAFGVYLTHLPARRAVHDADLGAPKQPVTLTTRSGLRLRGWYVPSRNGAAVMVIHGTASNRLGVVDHARLLARHGYGVLLMDLHGHGESEGRSTSVGWDAAEDTDAALAYLQRRPDVRDGRIGIVGVSLGGEVAVGAAAAHPEWRATVLEGIRGGTPADLRSSRSDPATFAALSAVYGVAHVLTGSGPKASREDLVARIAPRPLLLLSAGRAEEAHANEAFARRSGAQLWNLPDASHASALSTDPAGYERRVIGFLDRALAQ